MTRVVARLWKQEGVLLHRLSWYISGKLWSSCHHPHIDSPGTPAGHYLQGFFLCLYSMPSAAPKPCVHPGCGVLVRDGTSRCGKHPQARGFADKQRGTRQQRGYGTEWTKLREVILKRDAGLCQPCKSTDRVTLAREVDHIKPKAEGGTDDESNLQSICRACHLTKTQAESKRGIARGWGGFNL